MWVKITRRSRISDHREGNYFNCDLIPSNVLVLVFYLFKLGNNKRNESGIQRILKECLSIWQRQPIRGEHEFFSEWSFLLYPQWWVLSVPGNHILTRLSNDSSWHSLLQLLHVSSLVFIFPFKSLSIQKKRQTRHQYSSVQFFILTERIHLWRQVSREKKKDMKRASRHSWQ